MATLAESPSTRSASAATSLDCRGPVRLRRCVERNAARASEAEAAGVEPQMVGYEADAGASPKRGDVFQGDVREDLPVTAVASANKELPHAIGHRAELAEVRKGIGALDECFSFAELWEESMSHPVQRLLLVAPDEPLGVDRFATIVNRDVERLHSGLTKTLALDEPDPPRDAVQFVLEAAERRCVLRLHAHSDPRRTYSRQVVEVRAQSERHFGGPGSAASEVRELAWSDITEKLESSKGITHPVQ